jgi:hypothetical protein
MPKIHENAVNIPDLGLGTRMVANVASQADLRVTGGVERVTLDGEVDSLTGAYVPKDKRITLSRGWIDTYGASTAYGLPYDNPMVSSTTSPVRLYSNVANTTMTINWRGTGLVASLARIETGGTFTVSNDGGGTTTHDTYNPGANSSFGNSMVVASGLTYGDHTTVITVTGTKGGSGASSGATVYVNGFDILTSTDATVKYTTGSAFPSGEKATVATAGSLSLTAISTATGRKDLVVMRAGETIPEVITGTASNSGDNLATFKSKNEIAYTVGVTDQSGKLANIWQTSGVVTYNSTMVTIGSSGTGGTTDYVMIGFIGTGISAVFETGLDRGEFGWSIDGGAETLHDLYSNPRSTKAFDTGKNLTYGYHQLKIRKAGSKNLSASDYWVILSHFDIYHPKAPACPADAMPLAEVIPTPANGWVRYDDAAGWVYTGTNWTTVSAGAATGGIVRQNANTNTTDKAEFTFVGTQCRIITTNNTANGKYNISIDGGANTLVDCYGSNNYAATYTSATLTPGVHTVTITMANAKHASSSSNVVNLDSIEVLPLPAQVRDVRNFSVVGDDVLEKLEEKIEIVKAGVEAIKSRVYVTSTAGIAFPINNSTLKIPYGNPTVDTKGEWDNATNRWTAKETCTIHLTAAYTPSTWVSNMLSELLVYKNGVHEISISKGSYSSTNSGWFGSTYIDVNAGDYIELYMYKSGGTNVTPTTEGKTTWVRLREV